MNINLYTDAPKHNLALMKISAWHKAQGDKVTLNMPIMPCDKSYASVLFDKNKLIFDATEIGGVAWDRYNTVLPPEIESIKPDYDLFKMDYSLGYTYRPCRNKCEFCKVPNMKHPDEKHHSIWEFHNPKFNKICLLNNNTFLTNNGEILFMKFGMQN